MSYSKDKREQQTGYVFLADAYYDGESNRRTIIGRLLYTGHRDVLWANHTGDPDIKDHTHVLWRESYSTSISSVAFRYNFPARLIQVVGRDTDHKNYKGAMIYLLHADRKSISQGKRKYSADILYGPWKSQALKVIDKYQSEHANRDNDIILILDWIDKNVNCSTADLVRWCCANNLYSVYRRSASVVHNVLREYRSKSDYDKLVDGIGNQMADINERIEQVIRVQNYQKGRIDSDKSRMSDENMLVIQDLLKYAKLKNGGYDSM